MGRLFWIVDNGSSHRDKAAKERLHQVDSRLILVHTPVHASWLNQTVSWCPPVLRLCVPVWVWPAG
jgi:hypothetical protein